METEYIFVNQKGFDISRKRNSLNKKVVHLHQNLCHEGAITKCTK